MVRKEKQVTVCIFRITNTKRGKQRRKKGGNRGEKQMIKEAEEGDRRKKERAARFIIAKTWR